jgi:hypothetical protein
MKPNIVCAVSFSILLIACTSPSDTVRDTALQQLAVNRTKWTGQGIHNYSFDYDVTANVFSPPLHIEVQNDLVSAATDRSSGATYSTAGLPTVDSLFAHIDALIHSASPDLRVTYDGLLGFPAKIEEGSNIPDAGAVRTVSNLQELP